MVQEKKKASLKQVLKLVDQLSPADLLELRRQLEPRNVTWSNVDLQSSASRASLFQLQEHKAAERVKNAFAKLQQQGILDESGRLVDKDLPPDMQPDSECDVGG